MMTLVKVSARGFVGKKLRNFAQYKTAIRGGWRVSAPKLFLCNGNGRTALLMLAVVLVATCLVLPTSVMAQAATSTQAKALGEVKSIANGTLVLATDEGKSLNVSLPDGVRVVQIPPGATDLKNATPITVQDLQVGDRVLVRGAASDGGKSIAATAVIMMKQSDVAAKQQKEREEWQKRGIGGLVSAVDPVAGTATISVTSFGGTKKLLIQTNKKTIVRRYAPNSVKFDEAKASTLAEIHPGDQLRARGEKNSDGTEFAADEIVAGTFRNIAGTVTTVNAADNSMTVMDVLSKKPVTVKISADSQIRKLPQPMAQRIAMRLKGQTPEGGTAPGGVPGGTPPAQAQGGPPQSAPDARGPQAGASAGFGGGQRGGGDLQQMLSRLPTAALNDFQKGDAVILVSTEGNGGGVTAITLLGGVEPILTASPGAQAMMLTPWSLSGGPGEAQ